MNERRIHQIFEISVLLKGAHALIECIGGLVLAFVSTSAITSLVNALKLPDDGNADRCERRMIASHPQADLHSGRQIAVAKIPRKSFGLIGTFASFGFRHPNRVRSN